MAAHTSGEAKPADRRHRVAIVGAGFGGLFAAKALLRAEVDVTVIDRTNHHLFQPLLYQMATGILAEGDIAPPIRDVLRRQRNTKIVRGFTCSSPRSRHRRRPGPSAAGPPLSAQRGDTARRRQDARAE